MRRTGSFDNEEILSAYQDALSQLDLDPSTDVPRIAAALNQSMGDCFANPKQARANTAWHGGFQVKALEAAMRAWKANWRVTKEILIARWTDGARQFAKTIAPLPLVEAKAKDVPRSFHGQDVFF